MVPDSILFYNGKCLLEIILSKDFEPDNRSVHFRSSGIFLFNIAVKNITNNAHNRPHKTIKIGTFVLFNLSLYVRSDQIRTEDRRREKQNKQPTIGV